MASTLDFATTARRSTVEIDPIEQNKAFLFIDMIIMVLYIIFIKLLIISVTTLINRIKSNQS